MPIRWPGGFHVTGDSMAIGDLAAAWIAVLAGGRQIRVIIHCAIARRRIGVYNRADFRRRMTHSKIPATVVAELNRQFNHELTAAHNYRAMSFWCEDQNLKGFARYFNKQASEENEHANKIVAHLIDRRVLPETAGIPVPKHSFKSLLEVALHAQALEQENTKGIHAAYESAVAAKDYPAQVLMHWFINEQVEEESWAAEMIERIQQSTCAGSLSDLDRHIERYLAEGLFKSAGE